MREKILHEIKYLEFEINETQRQIEKEAERFKTWVASLAAQGIPAIPLDHVFQSIAGDCKKNPRTG